MQRPLFEREQRQRKERRGEEKESAHEPELDIVIATPLVASAFALLQQSAGP
jgi:hypothetical protein